MRTRAPRSWVDLVIWPVVVSLVVGALTGWLANERRLTRLEVDVQWIRAAVARIEYNVKED
jgi:hypothetical protein